MRWTIYFEMRAEIHNFWIWAVLAPLPLYFLLRLQKGNSSRL